MTAVAMDVTFDGGPSRWMARTRARKRFLAASVPKMHQIGDKKVFITVLVFLAGRLMLFLCNRQDGDMKECQPRACQKSAVKRPKKQVKTKA
ncbi:hypothetical protein GIY62_33695 [Burkholderia plantarii]|uniref:hypothetical protein n=1 Tax=Burkholderia plantarii TaxID=41899 RepID=UPI00272BCB96|nr:hypothetical protein [Burkholderia plantarii]WLE64085.1 hypothetical protein GIY62_33695 [Burkholderia plantarii]